MLKVRVVSKRYTILTAINKDVNSPKLIQFLLKSQQDIFLVEKFILKFTCKDKGTRRA